MPPPKYLLVFPEIVELETESAVPMLKMPAPLTAEFPVIVDEEIASDPEFLKAPPLPEVKFAPETVDPKRKRLPPVSISKMLKLPLLPLMISEDAPKPLIVNPPAVEDLAIEGSEEVREIV